jgi:TDG/mug DNA glycosylase family protein
LKPLPDIVADDLLVLFCGINPGLLSASTGHNFARPGNRFWPALHGAGFTPRLLKPEEDGLLPSFGLGITNLVDRASPGESSLSNEELREGAAALEALVGRIRPRVLAMVGIGAYRTGFRRPRAGLGLQEETVAGVPVWVLPNTSGLNAHHQLPSLIEQFTALRTFALTRKGVRPL